MHPHDQQMVLLNNDGYQTVRQPLKGQHPLKSFAQMGGAPPIGDTLGTCPPPPGSPRIEEPTRHATSHHVRPAMMVVASPTLRHSSMNETMKPAGIVIGQKSSNGSGNSGSGGLSVANNSHLMGGARVPIGRAQAQPRVNLADVHYSPYSTVRVPTTENNTDNDDDKSGSRSRLAGCDMSYNSEEVHPLKVRLFVF